MNWQSLHTNKRLLGSSRNISETNRGDYIKDYDRVIFSSPFRKLQNKTQVFPLPGTFFVHNRLTHSLEVASVGRSLGKSVGEKLAEKHKENLDQNSLDFYRFELSDVIQTACLAHDIGNPPFGHFGEEAIRTFFSDFFGRHGDLGLSENQKLDFIKFEGNANAFRILTSLFAKEGLKLTYTTLASVVKYPCSSSKGFNKSSLNTKKSGFMDSEAVFFEDIAQTLNIPGESGNYKRHPFVYLVEAADDICYRIIDLEDAYKLKLISYTEAAELLLPLFENSGSKKYLEDKLVEIKDEAQRLSLFRALLINHLTQLCSQAFLNYEEQLLAGTLNDSLINLLDSGLKDKLKQVDRFSVSRIYNNPLVIEKELSGYHVIYGLLDEFTNALVEPNQAKSQKVMCLLPDYESLNNDAYQNLLKIIDYISQMTDDFAMDLYKKIKGIF